MPSSTRKPKQVTYICYYRVSTQKQGQSGLGLDAQRESITRYIECHPGHVVAEFTETESGKRASNRPQLNAALELCTRKRATLVIARLDRLARNVHFISGLMESGVNFVAVEHPSMDRLGLHVLAAFSEAEARLIGQRTKDALAAAKRRGIEIGASGKILAIKHKQEALEKAKSFADVFRSVAAEGAKTTAQFRDALNQRGLRGPGGGRWHLPNTWRVLMRLGMKLPKSRKSTVVADAQHVGVAPSMAA